MRLIPCPENVVFSDGGYVFGKKSGVFSTSDRARKAFDDFIGKFCGYPPCDGNDILFKSDGTDDNSEEYSLEITPSGISVDAKSERGLFYGVQTLKQIIAVRMDDKTGEAVLPSLKIIDKPRFSYRGFMFDCVRHFFPVETVKKYIDAMAILKLNVFHWHLTDDQGWRVEIDGYPELITTGSKRRETMRDKTPHGGYYTKDDVREIVNYASDRFIAVVPEFDIPGHTRAAVASYPELGCRGEKFEVSTKFGIHGEILCAGKDASYKFVRDVLDCIAGEFPSPYVHIGGDEAVKHEWYACENCQNKMRELGLKNEEELQAYFTEQAINHLKTLGKTAICWNESANSGKLEKSAVLQFWADGKKNENVVREVKAGRKIIVSKFDPYYLDYPYAMHPLKAVYAFEPVFEEIKEYPDNVLGVESPIWTEWVGDEKTLEYRVFPRLIAVAETAWSNAANKNYRAFVSALPLADGIINCETGINVTPASECNAENPFVKAKQMFCFGIKMLDFETINRARKNNKEMKKMRSLRKEEEKEDKR